MGWILLTLVAAAWAMVVFGVFNLWVAIIVTVVAVVAGAMFLDLVTRGSGSAIKDQNQGNYSAPMGNETWQVPTSYIDHRTGTGPPPGVERYDEEEVDKLLGDRAAGRRDSSD